MSNLKENSKWENFFNENIKKLEETKNFSKKNIKDFKKSDIKILQNLINFHSNLYYNEEKPIISDLEYDELFKKLEILEKKFGLEKKQTDLVWANFKESSFKKVAHSRPMISLDNTYNWEDLKKFNERVIKNIFDEKKSENLNTKESENLNTKESKNLKNIKNLNWKNTEKPYFEKIKYTLEYKFDWVWIELIYKNWKLIQAITRWNWIEWEDVTENIMQIKNIPKKINYPNYLEIRWEIVMPISSFEKLNFEAKKTGEKIFSNPRNAASWSIRMKNNEITKKRNLQFFAYDLANFEEFILSEKKENYFEVIKDLEKLWFEISSYFEEFDWIEKLIEKINNFSDFKKNIDFEVDGLVVKVVDINLWKKIGSTEHHPKYAIAYKFPAEIFTTKIISVEHQIGRTGTLTPVANLEKINIWWVIVKRATLHNYEEIEDLDIKIWDNIFIKRAWEVIPKIISTIKELRNWEEKTIKIPEFCPNCETKLKKDEWKVRVYCPNFFWCSAQIKEKLVWAIWKNWFNIDWFWEKQIKLFFDLWFIKNLSDIFELEKYKKEILDLEWFQEKSVNKLFLAIQKAKKVEIKTLIASLSIFWVWKKVSKILQILFKSKDDLLNFSYSYEEIEKLYEIWPEIWQNVYNFFNNLENKIILKKLEDILEIKYFVPLVEVEESEFFWKKVCITGSFEKDWKKISRDDLIEKLEKKAWFFINSVSKNTDFLLAWEKAGTKLKKALELWIEVLNLEGFLEKLKK